MQRSGRKDYIWNTAAGVINAAEVIVMSMIVTRFGLLSDAGILSLAFAVANVLMAVGAFGGRMYQATDIRKQYTFRMYMIHRLFALGLMIMALVGVVLFGGYDGRKLQAIIVITIIYMIEVVENCIWGHFQSMDLLYVGAQMFCTRWLAIFVVFTGYMIAFKDMIGALFAGAAFGTVTFFVWTVYITRPQRREVFASDKAGEAVKASEWFPDLLKQTFPLFAAGFCSLFINNIPKFAIDRYLNDEIQACYGFVAMPVFVIGLLNQFIYQPMVAGMSTEYLAGNITVFRKKVRKQTVQTAGIMLICVCGAAAIGIPMLSLIYHTDLTSYRTELVILQFAGGFLALSGFFNVVLTIMRKQVFILLGYAAALVLGMVILYVAVKYAGTIGASVGYLIVMILLFIFYFVSYLMIINKKKNIR